MRHDRIRKHKPELSSTKQVGKQEIRQHHQPLPHRERNAILIVLSPDSFMYRVATLMCMPIHDDAETARRAALNGES